MLLTYDHESGFIYGTAHQADDMTGPSVPRENVTPIFTYDGEVYKAESKGPGKEIWSDISTISIHGMKNTIAEVVAFRVLAATGTYCKSQAFTDLQDPAIGGAAEWQQIVDEAKDLFSVCRVMMR